MADALVEHISAVVLDGGEPLSFRSLGAAAQVDAVASSRALEQFARSHEDQVNTLRVSIERSAGGATAVDPRARVIRLHAGPSSDAASQVYALYRKQQSEGEHQERIAVACWEQERKARGEIFAQVKKHAPMTSALKVYYASGIACAEATARTEFGDAKGEETVSAFDSINRSKKPSGSSAFFKNTGTAASSSTAAPSKSSSAASSSSSSFFGKSSSSTASKTTSSNGTKTSTTTAPSKPEVKRVNAESMSNVLSVDSSDEESDKEETDAPKFVKKSGPASRSKRVISDDDEDMEEVEAAPAKRNSKSSAPKRKLQSSKADKDERDSPKKDEPEEQSPKKPRIINEEDIVIPTKRRVLVNKTRITPEGYMVTEKTYEEHELTSEEIESERQAAIKKQRAAADRAAKASKEKAQAGPRKQKDLRSFFMKK